MSDNNAIVQPKSWDAFIGQERMKDRLQISINAALDRLSSLDHVLLAGPPGTGKTTLAWLIAQELGDVEFTQLTMPIKTKALQKIIIESHGVLFLDEIHRLKSAEQEELLTVLENGIVQFANGEKYKLEKPLTIIGATTELQDVIKPLRERFTHRPKFQDYNDDEMAEIVRRMASKCEVYPSEEESLLFGRASAGIPRQARTIVFTARDLQSTDPELVLGTCGITNDGLTEDHVDYMLALHELGGQAGVDAISNYTDLPKDIIVDLEKLLMKRGFVMRKARGRELSVKGMLLSEDLK